MNTKHMEITGAGGFVGQRLATLVLSEPSYADARFTLVDLPSPAANVRVIEGDLFEQAAWTDALGFRHDVSIAALIEQSMEMEHK